MKNIRRVFAFAICVLLLSICCFASKMVTIPSFNVELNGTQVKSETRLYPLIVCNDITYFPMTYHDCQYLGLVSSWDDTTKTLTVSKSTASGAYNDYASNTLNSMTDFAEVCNFNIVVNGKPIDNSAEQYPLLVYRDVTYFPLTWRFAVTEFGWSYSFTTKKGLVIASVNSPVSAPEVSSGVPSENKPEKPTVPQVDVPDAMDEYIDSIENGNSVTDNYWGIWGEAVSAKGNGNYKETINKILSISSAFIKDNIKSPASNAMLFMHLGDCHAELGELMKASACYEREAYYWGMTEGQEQTKIDAERRANLIKPYTMLYALTTDEGDYGDANYYGALHEPLGGVYLGVIDEMAGKMAKPAAAVLEYIDYGSDNPFNVNEDQIMQLSLQPVHGIDEVNDWDGYLISLAQSLEDKDYKVILRFAGEMNDPESNWAASPEAYIEKFRLVADIFHEYAPSVPVVWAPNFYPTDNIEAYYPGDEYVDYVGVSLYQEYQPETDPLDKGVDRSRWINVLDFIYKTYSQKKPIIVVEGGVAYRNNRTDKDLTDYSVDHINEFFAYLPIRYPNVKMFFMFNVDDMHGRKFDLVNNPKCLDAFNNGIKSKYYYSSTFCEENQYGYYSLENRPSVNATKTEICSYTYVPTNNVSYVNYYINGEKVAVSYGMPYSASVDFSDYSGQTVTLTAKAFDADFKLVSEKSCQVSVE